MKEEPETPEPARGDASGRNAKTLKDLLLYGPSWDGIDLERDQNSRHREIDVSWIDGASDALPHDDKPVQADARDGDES